MSTTQSHTWHKQAAYEPTILREEKDIQMTDFENKARKLPPARVFMIVAVNKDDPSEVWGYNAKQGTFYRGMGHADYFNSGKHSPRMLNELTKFLHTHFCIGGTAFKSHRCKGTYVGMFFDKRKHLNHNMEIKLIHLSSEKCPYYATKYVDGSWWPMVRIMPREQVIKWFESHGKTAKDAYANSILAQKMAIQASIR